jgi:hypothetical protein
MAKTTREKKMDAQKSFDESLAEMSRNLSDLEAIAATLGEVPTQFPFPDLEAIRALYPIYDLEAGNPLPLPYDGPV